MDEGSSPDQVPNSDTTEAIPGIVGWVSSGTDRGTVDIMWSCCATIVLCVWVSTYPNAPSMNDKWYHHIQDKFNLACTGFLGPDLLFALAVGQLSSARKSVKNFKDSPELRRGHDWTMKHAFFADMGGFHLASPDYPQGFPINAEQLYYLVRHGYLDFPVLTLADISHMNKADTLSRILVLWQVMWFTITEFDRIAGGHPITTLELTTLTFSCVMIATSASWYHKPSISRSLVLWTKGDRFVREIRDFARVNTHPRLPLHYYRTPLDFISRRNFPIDKHWAYYARLSQICRVPLFNREVTTVPWDRLPSDSWVAPEGWLIVLGMVIMIPFSVAFLAAWNFHFPTEGEKWMWRASAVFHAVYTVVGTFYYIFASLGESKSATFFGFRTGTFLDGASTGAGAGAEVRASASSAAPPPPLPPKTIPQREAAAAAMTVEVVPSETSTPPPGPLPQPQQPQLIPRPPERTFTDSDVEQGDEKRRTLLPLLRRSTTGLTTWVKSWKNLSLEQDPDMAVPLRWIVPFFIPTFLYIMCRLYFYAEDFAGLREQPGDVYEHQRRLVPFM